MITTRQIIGTYKRLSTEKKAKLKNNIRLATETIEKLQAQNRRDSETLLALQISTIDTDLLEQARQRDI